MGHTQGGHYQASDGKALDGMQQWDGWKAAVVLAGEREPPIPQGLDVCIDVGH